MASEVAKEIGLKNVTFQHGDVGECREKFNYVVSRAVMPLNNLIRLVAKNISPRDAGNTYATVRWCLKAAT